MKRRLDILKLVSNKFRKVFLSKDTKLEDSYKFDILLSPELYWVRIFSIPVKNETQAKEVLPTLFEDIINSKNKLNYQVIKIEENKYLCFAYENKRILDCIKTSGISFSNVHAIYFAQNECIKLKDFMIENKSFFYTNENILVKVPNELILTTNKLEEYINDIELSVHKVDIKLYNNIISKKYFISLFLICLTFCFINLYKYIELKNNNILIQTQIKNIMKKNKLPSSSIQTDNILKKYRKNIENEIKKRDFLHYVLKENKFKMNEFDLKKNIVVIRFQNTNKKDIEEYISKKYNIISSRVKSFDLELRIKI